MTKEELRRLIVQMDKEFEKRKFRRVVITILAIAAVIFYFCCKTGEVYSIETGLGCVFGALFLAGVYFYVNMLIFGFLCNKSDEENKALESLKKQLREMEE